MTAKSIQINGWPHEIKSKDRCLIAAEEYGKVQHGRKAEPEQIGDLQQPRLGILLPEFQRRRQNQYQQQKQPLKALNKLTIVVLFS